MPAPVWAASPPEVHSSLLSAGPGAGSLLASAAAWSTLAADYNSIAEELTAVLGAVQSEIWTGPSAEAYVAANGPYLAWLRRAGAQATSTAAALQTAAGAYASALAAMPTMAELAANHAAHAVLVGTNFFGVNTIPIALNEANYARMWAQAAAVMTTYEATADASVTSVPQLEAAPPMLKVEPAMLKTLDSADSAPETAPEAPQWFTDFAKWLEGFVPQAPYPDSSQYPLYVELQEFFNKIGYTGIPDPLADFFAGLQNGSNLLPPIGVPGSWLGWTGNPLSYLNPATLAYIFSVPLDPVSYIVFTSKVIIDDLIAVLYTALFNPQALGVVIPLVMVEIIGSTIGNTIQLLNYTITQTALLPVLLPALAATTALAPVGVVGGLGVGALAHHATTEAVVPPPSPAPPSAGLTMAQPSPSAPAPAPAPTPAPPPTPTPTPAPAPPPTPAGPPSVSMPAYGYMVGGLDMGARRAAGSRTRKKAASKPAADEADVAEPEEDAAAPRHRRRREKVGMHGRGHKYMYLDQDLAPDPVAMPSDRGAGSLGFAGSAPREGTAPPAGLAKLAGDEFGGGAVSPMLPNTWPADGDNG